MNINNDSYTWVDYMFDPLGIIHPIEGKEKFKPDLDSPVVAKILQVAAKALMTLAAALLTVGTLFIPFTVYCRRVSKEKRESDQNGFEPVCLRSSKKQVHSREAMPSTFEDIGKVDVAQTLYLTPDEFLEKLKKKSFEPGQEIQVNGNVEIYFDSELANSLPDNLTIEGDLTIFSCKDLSSLPKKLKIIGTLKIRHSSKLTSLPPDIKFNKYDGEVGAMLFYDK